LPKRAEALVIEWAKINKLELMNEWENSIYGKSINKIKPLE
jgi:hypothetical protein